MISKELKKRLGLFESQLVIYNEEQIILEEKDKQGTAELKVTLQNPSILFKQLDKHKLNYFVNKKSSDHVIFEQNGDSWNIHIFELKRTITEKSWETIKIQFAGALQHALAFAGVLDIEIDLKKVFLYSVYRNDKLRDLANPVKMRLNLNSHGEVNREWKDWFKNNISIMTWDIKEFSHKKISLNIESGKGRYIL